MYHVIFQVRPSPAGYQAYLDTAARLRPQLDTVRGFLSIERFRSLERDGWILSLSKWADEASLTRWRTMPEHHQAQQAGRDGVFDDYRLRVAQVASRLRPSEPEWTPQRRTPYRSAQGPARFVSVLEVAGIECARLPPPNGADDGEWHESLSRPGNHALVAGWRDEAAARAWQRDAGAALAAMPGAAFDLNLLELERDYGLFPREEAPQFYPPAQRERN